MKKLIVLVIIMLASIGYLLFSPNEEVEAQTEIPFYSQNDSSWASETLGKGTEADQTIGNYGCGLTSAAMVLNYYGWKGNPLDLNNALLDADVVIREKPRKVETAFNSDYLVWGAEASWKKATGGMVKGTSVYWYGSSKLFDEKILKDNLAHDRPVIVFIANKHYVVVVGSEERVDEITNKPKTVYLINDPWVNSEANGSYIDFDKNAIGYKSTSSITQAIILHTDQNLPVDGPLVDWPAIQDKYASLGGVDGWLKKPLEDDEYMTAPDGVVEIRTQAFEGGKIYTYRAGSDNPWNTYVLSESIAAEYDKEGGLLGKYGKVLTDAYPQYFMASYHGDMADFENASFFASTNGDIEILTQNDSVTAEYFNNPDLSGEPIFTSYKPKISFIWENVSPHPIINETRYSVRLKSKIFVELLAYERFTVKAEGGVRLFVNGDNVLDAWDATEKKEYTAKKFLFRGSHEIVVEFRNSSASASVDFSFAPWPLKLVHAEEEADYSWAVHPASWRDITDNPPEEEPDIQVIIPAAPAASVVIDELSSAFIKTDSGNAWQESTSGYDGHYYWVAGNNSTGTARWEIDAVIPGKYTLYAYIPASHATTSAAVYSIYSNTSYYSVAINQAEHHNEWVRLGDFEFSGDVEEYLELSPGSEPAGAGGEVAIDAIAIQFVRPGALELAWKNIKKAVTDFWNRQKQRIQDWIDRQSQNIERDIETWLLQQLNAFLLWLQQLFMTIVQQFCASLYLFILVPGLPLAIQKWKSRRR